jgi:hypothetical protein
MVKVFDILGYGQIEDYIDNEDLDEEDLTDTKQSSSEEESDQESEDESPEEIPASLQKSNLQVFTKEKKGRNKD